jgi:hypothetical protein
MKVLLTALCILTNTVIWTAQAQNEVFHDIDIGKQITENEKWEFAIQGKWKHIYNEVGWRRIGVNPEIIRKLNKWSFATGATAFHTFDSIR